MLAMARLTGLTKTLIGLTVGGALVAAYFTHGERVRALLARGGQRAAPSPAVSVDRRQGQLVLALCEWPGQMPFVVGNGGLTTQPGSAAAAEGLDVKIVFLEDPV
jgi:hypothetical protein